MMIYTRKRPIARGCRHGGRNSVLGFVVYFDDETADEIRARAEREDTSFSEQVRLLVQWGLMETEEKPL